MTNPNAVQVDVNAVIEVLTNRIGADAHEIAGLRALAQQQAELTQQQAAELDRLTRVVESLTEQLAQTEEQQHDTTAVDQC